MLEVLGREKNLEKELLWTPYLLEKWVWELNQGPAPRALYPKKIGC